MASAKSVQSGAKSARSGACVLETGAHSKAAASLAVIMAPEIIRTLSPRKAAVKAVMESLGKVIAGTKRSGRSGGFTVTIDPDGKSEITALAPPKAAAEPAVEAERERAFAAARARGRIKAADVLSRADMLSAEELGDRLGISRVTVNARRQRHELLGLDGAKRGFRFPDWQVDDDGRPIEALPRLFELLGPSPWGVYRFLTQRHDVLNGAIAKDALRRGQTDQVLDAAESLARGDFA